MSDTTFSAGTVINHQWLNDVNAVTYRAQSSIAGSTNRTALSKLSDVVSVKDFGAVGNGVTDDTAAFLLACGASNSVYVPYSSSGYLINGLNVPNGVRIWGPGNIKTSGGTIINLGQINLEFQENNNVMFIESNKQGWEELLDIKSCGYTTIMAYLWYTNLADVVANAAAVGLKVLVHSKYLAANIASWNALATAATAYDSYTNVIGYYVFDEPATHSISVADQNTGIGYFRALTSKPLSCAEGAVTYSATGSISSNYDEIFIDVYYPNSSSTGNDQLAAYIRNITAFGAAAPTAKLIPLLGLFNDIGFSKSTTVTAQLAAVLQKFSRCGTFGVFCWNSGTAGTYQGVRNVAAYRAAAKTLCTSVKLIEPWRVEVIPVGTLFTTSNRLGNVYYNTTDTLATPGIPAAANLVPWYVQNVGVATNNRQQAFTDNGLMYKGTSARAGFSGMPAGICCGYLRWDNRETAASCDVSMGASSTLGYTVASAITQTITNATAVAFYKQLDAGGQFMNMPIIEVTTAGALTFPNNFLKGYLTFTTVPEVSF